MAERRMEKALLVKGQKKFAAPRLRNALGHEASLRAGKRGIRLMKLKIVTGQFENKETRIPGDLLGQQDGKTQTKAESRGRSAHKARSAASRGSIAKRASHGSKSQGVRSRRSRTSGRYGSTRISLSNQTTHNLVLPHESAL